MSNRVKIIEDSLNVSLPQPYKDFINEVGVISDERGEVYGYIEQIDIRKIPCVIGATNLYKLNYSNISLKDIVIAFDDFKNMPIVLNTVNERIYALNDDKKVIATSFLDWFEKYITKQSSQ